MATKIKSAQILDGAIVAADLHSAIAINTTQSGTFGSVIVDDITLDGTSISTPSSMLLNVGGNLTIDVDGTYITLADDGDNWGQFFNSQQNFYINNPTADKDIIFRGVKAGTPNTAITALTLDMANDGRATFNENVSVGGDLAITGNIDGNVVITGDLTVEGAQVTLETTALDVEDKNITLNYHATNDTSASANGAGITIQDAISQGNDASILWNASDDTFDFSANITAPSSLTLTSNAPRIYLYEADTTDLNTALFSSGGAFTIRTTTDDDSTRTTRLQVSHSTGDIGFYENNGGTPQVGMHWDYADGYLGIGTTSPSTALHVDPGYVTLGTSDGTDNSWINNVEDGNLELVNEGRSTNDGAVRINRKNNPAGDTTYFRDTAIYDGKSNIVLFVDGSEAEVGIGTDAPDHKLHVVGDNDTTLVEFEVGDKAKFNFGADSTSLYTTTFYIDDTGLDIGHDSSYRSLNLKTAGTDRITILPAGNVGIGTDDPEQLLHIHNSSGDWGAEVVLTGRLSTGTPKAEVAFKRGTSGDGAMLVLRSSNGSGDLIDAVTVKDGTGNVGIGTGSPNTPLEIHGSDIATSATTTASSVLRLVRDIADSNYPNRKDSAVDFRLSRQQAVNNNYPYTRLDIRLAGETDVSTPSLDVMSLLHNGNVGIGTTDPTLALDVRTQAVVGNGTDGVKLTYSTGNSSGIIDTGHSSTALEFRTGNSFAAMIDSSGNVGIGEPTPLGKLHVRDGTAQAGIEHSYIYNQSAISIEATEPSLQLMAEDSGTHGGSVLWRYGNNTFAAIANPTTDAIDFTYGVTTADDFQVHSGAYMSSYLKIMSIGADGKVGIGTDDPSHKLDVDGAIATRQVRHDVRPTLNLDFASSKKLDSRITFYRDSIATYYDSKGILRYANHNEPRFDHDPLTGESKGLLIEEDRTNLAIGTTNSSGMPIDFNNMYNIINTRLAPDGTMSATDVLASPGVSRHEVNIRYPGTAGDTYSASLYVKPLGSVQWLMLSRAGGTDKMGFDLINITTGEPGGTASGTISEVGNGWIKLTFTYVETTTGGTRSVYMSPGITTPSSSVYSNLSGDGVNGVAIWGPQVESGDVVGGFSTSYIPLDRRFTSRSSVATYHDETGILRTAPENGSRYGYMYDGRRWVETGLILEDSSTNLITYSQDLANWNITRATLSPNVAATTAPDGSNTADKLEETAVSGEHAIIRHVAIPNTGHATLSIYAKAAERNVFGIQMYNGGGGVDGNPLVYFNLTTGTVSQSNGGVKDATITYAGNDWWRITLTGNISTAGVTASCWMYTSNSTGYTAHLGEVGKGVYLWGGQLEQNSKIASSYIYTAGSAKSRSADVFSSVAYTRKSDYAYIDIEQYDFWNDSESTIYAETETYIPDYTSGNYNASQYAFAPDSGRVQVRYDNTDGIHAIGYTQPGGVFTNIFTLTPPTATFVTSSKTALSIKQDDYDFSVNGSTVSGTASDNGGSFPIPTSLFLGAYRELDSPGNSEHLNGVIKKLSYYDTKLSNDEMQALTENN